VGRQPVQLAGAQFAFPLAAAPQHREHQAASPRSAVSSVSTSGVFVTTTPRCARGHIDVIHPDAEVRDHDARGARAA
jgi:hypothetical protein